MRTGNSFRTVGTRFGLLSTILGAVFAGTALPRVAVAADLTVPAYGGVWEEAVRACYIPIFERKTGKTVDVVLGGPAQWINQIAANKNSPPLDILVAQVDSAEDAAAKGLVDMLDAARVPNLAEIPQEFKTIAGGHAVVANYGTAGLAYNTQTIKNPPKSWDEFINRTIAGEWTASIPGISTPTNAVPAVIWNFADLYGGGLSDIGPAIAKVKELQASGHLIFWSDANEFITQVQGGEADIGIYYDGRAWGAHDRTDGLIGFVNPAPGGVISQTVFSKVKNGSEAAWDYLDAVLSVEGQGCFAKMLQYGVANPNVKYDETLKSRITPWKETRTPPYREITAKMPEWVETWNKEIGR